jgi:hypothetical protein
MLSFRNNSICSSVIRSPVGAWPHERLQLKQLRLHAYVMSISILLIAL